MDCKLEELFWGIVITIATERKLGQSFQVTVTEETKEVLRGRTVGVGRPRLKGPTVSLEANNPVQNAG